MPPTPSLRASGNALLDRLPAEEFARVEPSLQRVALSLREVVQQFEQEVAYIHFPTTGLLSLLTVLEEDDPVESGTVGRGGFVGVAASLGVEQSPHRVICQLPGDALRMPLGPFLAAMEAGPALRRLVGRYIAFTLRDLSQSIACNALHGVEARASRWLLLLHDQAGRDEFPITQEFLSFMLGVRRQTVTVVAGALQSAGLIAFRRGNMAIRDRDGLEMAACECYAAVCRAHDRVLA